MDRRGAAPRRELSISPKRLALDQKHLAGLYERACQIVPLRKLPDGFSHIAAGVLGRDSPERVPRLHDIARLGGRSTRRPRRPQREHEKCEQNDPGENETRDELVFAILDERVFAVKTRRRPG